MTGPLAYEFSVDPAETVRACRELRRRQAFAWVEWAVWPALFILAALYLLVGRDWRALWPLGLVALVILLFQALLPLVQRWQIGRAYQATPNLRGAQAYRFSDAGLRITGGAATIELGWDSFVEVAETKEFFLFFYSKQCAYYLPKRVARDHSQRDALRALLRAKLGPRAARLQSDVGRDAPA